MKTRTTLILLSLFLIPKANADIDLRSGAFIKSQQDRLSTLRLERVYHSRSLQKGLFGFGWCTDLDSRIELTSEGELYLWDCHRAGPARFLPNSRPTGRGIAEAGLAFTSEELPDDRILYTRNVFERKNSGRQQTFDGQGRLSEFIDESGGKWSLRRDADGKILSLQGARESLLVEMDPLGEFIRRLEGPSKSRLEYLYDGDRLREVTSPLPKKFEYDPGGNLTRILEDGRPSVKIRYDVDADRVVSLRRDDCVQNLTWKKAGPSTRVELTKQCPGRAPKRRAVELSARGAVTGIFEETKGYLP